MNKTITSGLSLFRLIDDAPVNLLVRYLSREETLSICGDEAASDARVRAVLRCTVDTAHDVVQQRLDDEAARVLRLAGEGEPDLARVALRSREKAVTTEFNAQPDALARSLWAFLEARPTFDDAESLHHATRVRGLWRPFSAFELAAEAGAPLAWSDNVAAALCAAVQKELQLKDACSASHLTVADGDGGEDLHVVILRHPGSLTSVAEHRDDGLKQRRYYKPSHEATLFYAPSTRTVEICAESPGIRQDVARSFAETVLGVDMSNKPLTFREYDLAPLQKSLVLPDVDVPGIVVTSARVTEIDLRPNDPNHRISLKVRPDDDIDKLAPRYLGATGILKWGTLIRAAILVQYVAASGASSLKLIVSYPNRCNLRNHSERNAQTVGQKLLEEWGILRRTKGATRSEERDLLPMLLDLLELEDDILLECDLGARGLDVALLTERRLVQPRGRHRLIQFTPDPDEDEPDLVDVGQGLDDLGEYIGSDGRSAWIPGSLIRQIEINRPYVIELALKLLRPLLSEVGGHKIRPRLHLLGQIDLDGPTPCWFGSRLDDPAIFAELDAAIRAAAHGSGYGVVLTSTANPPPFLGANVVVPLGEKLAPSSDGIRVDVSRIVSAYRTGRGLATRAAGPVLIEEDGIATLHLPPNPPLALLGKRHIAFFRTLVDAHSRGMAAVPTNVAMKGNSSGTPSRLFGVRWSSINDVYVEKVGDRGGWRLKT